MGIKLMCHKIGDEEQIRDLAKRPPVMFVGLVSPHEFVIYIYELNQSYHLVI